jgi:hypothetical protein
MKYQVKSTGVMEIEEIVGALTVKIVDSNSADAYRYGRRTGVTPVTIPLISTVATAVELTSMWLGPSGHCCHQRSCRWLSIAGRRRRNQAAAGAVIDSKFAAAPVTLSGCTVYRSSAQ